MAYILCTLSFIFLLLPSISHAELGNGVGEINLAGWIKQADGTYAKAFSDSNGSSTLRLSSAPIGIEAKSTALVQTSKGLVNFDILKTANVDVSRVGKAVSKFAQKVGPV